MRSGSFRTAPGAAVYLSEQAQRVMLSAWRTATENHGREVVGVCVGERFRHPTETQTSAWLVVDAAFMSIGTAMHCEITADQFRWALEEAEQLKARLGTPHLNFIGGFHSHPSGAGRPSDYRHWRDGGDLGGAQWSLRHLPQIPDTTETIMFHNGPATREEGGVVGALSWALRRERQDQFEQIDTRRESDIEVG